ncbi:serine protease [Microbispora sp. NEAU-D428]|uniref:trypsin-like serine peptidase n=1 Tax=Microbispora sitophila TaxID=2771537 RepID=UPI0018691519|nr:serine protease [Microbispora sitophila]MBE3015496.1 serine protease [Microbispora sitophila]
MIPRARRLAVPLTGALLAAGVVGATPATSSAATGATAAIAAALAAPGEVTAKAAPQTPAEAVAFWSPQRLRAAKDYTEELGNSVKGFGKAGDATPDGKAGTVPPAGAARSGAGGSGKISKQVNLPRTVGRVFFTLPGKNPLDPKSWKYCSGTSVQGHYRNVVATAGHCVYDPVTNQFYDNWVFIPSYWDGDQAWEGKAPYGIYPAKWFQTHDDFVVREDYDYDYAFVNVSSGFTLTPKKDGDVTHYVRTPAGRLGDNVGGQGFTWNRSTKVKVFAFGYPAGPHPDGDRPFTGRTMKWCYGQSAPMPAVPKYDIQEHLGFSCGMTSGASGGPWLMGYKSATRTGYLNGISSVAWDSDGNDRYDRISSPYFNGETYDVYAVAANRWTQ